jgi:hypothetical protein
LESKLSREPLSPEPECRLPNVESLAILSERLHHKVNMRMRLIGVEHHAVTMLKCEFLASEISYSFKHPLWRRSRGHGKQNLMHKLRMMLGGPSLEFSRSSDFVNLKVPLAK